MNFVVHGTTLALAWFLVVNLIASVVVGWLATRPARSTSPTFWFVARILPGSAAALFVSALFVPSYWRYEPRETLEGFDLTLTACAIAAAALLAAGAIRGALAWWFARGRTRRWLRTARESTLVTADTGDTTIRAFEMDADRPLMALVGVLHPRLFVTRGLIAALSEEELAACVAHETGHSHAWDNLKRLAMRACPDALFFTNAARELERRWASASEHAADQVAGHSGAAARCALASALVKVARLIPADPRVREPISTLVGGGEIASRVRRLLDDASPSPGGSRTRVVWIGSTAALIGAAVTYAPLLRAVHHATELLVHSLP
jgi:Zn-dependent protease with chaperone function